MKQTILLISAVILTLGLSNCNPNESEKTKPETATAKPKEACTAPMTKADSANAISKTIEVKGEVEHPLLLTVDSLKKMNTVVVNDFKVVCQHGAPPKEGKTTRGVLLKDILDKAKIKQNSHKDRNFFIVARATDNYMATFSWAELFNNPTGDSTLVIFEENGEPIKQRGDMILNCTNDIKTGVRHVRWLKSIEVYRVN
jgi:DMSO/TMAO reductase YedYZ molybdopterin-dependent catalytic subunit